MNPKFRELVYVAAFVLAVVVAGLVMFGRLDSVAVKNGVLALAVVYGGVSALAYRNVN